MNDTFAAAETIAAARRSRKSLQPLSKASAPQTEAEGYRIADAVHGLLARDFGEMVGHKIGCTSAVMQQYLNIPHPCSGGVFANGVHSQRRGVARKGFHPRRRRMRNRRPARPRSDAARRAVHRRYGGAGDRRLSAGDRDRR